MAHVNGGVFSVQIAHEDPVVAHVKDPLSAFPAEKAEAPVVCFPSTQTGLPCSVIFSIMVVAAPN